jgi:pyruvate dehydrogenase E2 component (dihydrolipoamide acetyltransferase)
MTKTEIKLPELGENLEGGEVLDVKVGEGDAISDGQTLIEIEAEKSTVDVPAPQAGRLTRLLVKKGDYVKVGQGICVIESGDGQKNGSSTGPVARPKEPASEPEPKAAKVQSGGDEPAESVAAAEGPGVTAAPRWEPKEPADGQSRAGTRSPARATPVSVTTLVPAGPATRRLARELGVDLRLVRGSAPGGRVTQDDIRAFVRQLAVGAATPLTRGQAPPLPDFENWGPVERRPLDAVRRRTADQMSLAWSLIPHVTQHDQADITELDAFRRQQEGRGPKLTVTAFALKAAAVALRQFEQFNATLDVASGQLILKRYYHVGVAVDTDRGLLVPVVRDVDKKSIHELAQELNDLAERARQKKVPVEEMRGGSFTITNLGGIGGTGFSPIVNYPEVAILGLARARLQPAVRDGQVVPRLLLPLSLSYDHRVIDGAAAARFTRHIAEMLENPLLILLKA